VRVLRGVILMCVWEGIYYLWSAYLLSALWVLLLLYPGKGVLNEIWVFTLILILYF
jgi:hypothetical protein